MKPIAFVIDRAGRAGQRLHTDARLHNVLMAHFVGLDVSLEETAICVVDDAGEIFRAGKAE